MATTYQWWPDQRRRVRHDADNGCCPCAQSGPEAYRSTAPTPASKP